MSTHAQGGSGQNRPRAGRRERERRAFAMAAAGGRGGGGYTRPTLCEVHRTLVAAGCERDVEDMLMRGAVLPEVRAEAASRGGARGGSAGSAAAGFSERLAADGTRSYLRRSGAATVSKASAERAREALAEVIAGWTDKASSLVRGLIGGGAAAAEGTRGPQPPPIALHPERLALAVARASGEVVVYDLENMEPPSPAAARIAAHALAQLLQARERAAADGGGADALLHHMHEAAALLSGVSVEGSMEVEAASKAIDSAIRARAIDEHAEDGAAAADVASQLEDALMALANAALGLRAPAVLSSALQTDARALAWRPSHPGTLAVGCAEGVALWKGLEAGWKGAARGSSAGAGGGGRKGGADAGTETMTLMRCGGHCGVSSLAWSPDGQRLGSGASSGGVSVVVWDAAARVPTPLWRRAGEVGVLRWSPGGDYLFASHGSGGRFRVWHTDSWKSMSWAGGHGHVYDACWNPEGNVLLLALEKVRARSARPWARATRALASLLLTPCSPTRPSCAHSMHHLALPSRAAQAAPLVALHFTLGPPSLDAQLLPVDLPMPAADGDGAPSPPSVRSLAWDSTGERLAVATAGGRVVLLSSRLDPVLSLSLVGAVEGPRASSLGSEAERHAAPRVALHSQRAGARTSRRTLAAAFTNGSVMLCPLVF